MTIYTARVRYHATGREAVIGFDTLTSRELCLLTIGPHVDVLSRGEMEQSAPILIPELLVPDNGRIH